MPIPPTAAPSAHPLQMPPWGVLALAPDGTVAVLNPVAEALWGVPVAAVLGYTPTTTTPAVLPDPLLRVLTEALQLPFVPAEGDYWLPHTEQWIALRTTLGAEGYVWVYWDNITARKTSRAPGQETKPAAGPLIGAAPSPVADADAELEWLPLAVSATGLGVFDWDLTTDQVLVNRRFRELLGLPAEGLILGTAMMSHVVHPQDQTFVAGQITKAHEHAAGRYEFEHRALTPTGTRWLLTFGQVHFAGEEPNRRAVRLVGSCLDLDERKNAEDALRRSEEQFRLFVTASSDLVYRASPDFQQLYNLNGKGFLADMEQPSDTWQQVYLPAEEIALVQAAIAQAVEAKHIYELEHRVIQADGNVGWIFSRAIPVLDEQGNITEWLGAASDVTVRKQAEQQLHAFNEQLQRANADLDTFIYTASHDLKAPISNIEGLLNMLHVLLPKGLRTNTKVAPVLLRMHDAVERFARTITLLTDVSKLQAEFAQAPTPVLLAPVVEDVHRDLLPLLTQTAGHLEITIADGTLLLFSEKNLRSVVYNLLSNALKYCHPSRPPRVRLSCTREGNWQHLRVQDNGLGLNTQQQKRLFQLFQRLHTHVEGTGVGLYMVKKMVENAGGSLAVDSQPDVGTTFSIRLPAAT